MKIINKLLKNPWVQGIGTPLILLFITDIILKQNWIGKGGSLLLYFLSLQIITRVWIILIIISTIIVAALLISWIKRKLFSKDWNTKIGHYTFKDLHSIMRTEHIYEPTHVLVQLSQADYSQFSVAELFNIYHSRLSTGVGLEDDLFLYHNLCPRLFMFGLMDKADIKDNGTGLILHHYTMNDNGKLFWAIWNKLSIKQRLKNEKNQLAELKAKTKRRKPAALH
jgi:hypothetical protein